MFWVRKKTYALTPFVLENTHNNRASKIQTFFYWKAKVSIWHAFKN